MKGNKLRGFLELSAGALLAMALMVICSLKVYANSVPGLMVERAVPLPPQAATIAIDDWVIYLFAGLVAVAAVVVVIVLLLRRKKTAKRPARLGMPPTTPPPMRPAIATPPAAAPQPSQPVAGSPPQSFQPVAAGTPRLIMPDNTEVPLSEGLRYMGRGDFERMVPPDRADYISRQHLTVGFSSGNYYVEDVGSGNGTKLNGRDLKGKGSQWLKDGDQIDVGGVAIFVFKTS
jgi:hypothetical protein